MAETTEGRGQSCNKSLAEVKNFWVVIGSLFSCERISWGYVVIEQSYVTT